MFKAPNPQSVSLTSVLIVVSLLVISIYSCEDLSPEVKINVNTDSIMAITSNSFLIEGKVDFMGSSEISDHGFCYSKSSPPTIENGDSLGLGVKTSPGTFKSKITGLDPNSKYYVRAFASNNNVIFYGEELSLYTLPIFRDSSNIWDNFSEVNNPNNGVAFGRKWSADGEDFDLFTYYDGTWLLGPENWDSPRIGLGNLWANDNSQGLPTVRWECPADGLYYLRYWSWGNDASESVNVINYIAINDSIYYRHNLNSFDDTLNYSINRLELNKQDYIDFLIMYNGGPTSNNNWVIVNATIRW